MAVALSTLVPDVRAHIPEVPSFIVQRDLIRATREFCERTRAWRVSVSMVTIASSSTISLTSYLPSNTELVDIISMKNSAGGAPVVPRTIVWLDENLSQWRTNNTSTTASYYVRESNTTIRLIPTPASVATYNVRMAVKPLLTATTIDDILVNKFRETFISGALSFLFMIPRKPWTDMNAASIHAARFESGMTEAKAEATDEFQTGIVRTVKYGGL